MEKYLPFSQSLVKVEINTDDENEDFEDFHQIQEGPDESDSDQEATEEIVEVEINANELDSFVNELRLIRGLLTEITCAEDDDPIPNVDERLNNESSDNPDELYYNDDDHHDHGDNAVEVDFPFLHSEVDIKCESMNTKPKVKLHKLDSFLMDKYFKADKHFLKSRFLTFMIAKQEKAEQSVGVARPVPLDDGTFLCHLCLNVYQTKKALNRHVREFHERSRVSKCDRCDYTGASPGALTNHVQIVHLKMFRYECPKCDQMKTQKRLHIVQHLIEVHNVAEAETASMITSKLRLKNRQIGDRHRCSRCSYSTPSKYTLKKHLNRKHGVDEEVDPETVCNLCHEEFLDKDSKARHPCPVRIKVKEDLEEVVANDDCKFLCPGCSRTFLLMVGLRSHYIEAHAVVEKVVKPIAKFFQKQLQKTKDKKPKTEDFIKTELPDCEGDEGPVEGKENEDGTYLCDQCPFIGSKEDLAWHVRHIHKDKMFKCELCLFSSNSNLVLSTHVKRVHDGIASHMCHLCPLACWSTKELGEHLKAHHCEETKHFFCNQPACEFWSRQANRLDKHVQRVHLRQKNFLCDKCEFRAFIQPELDAHIREKHLKIFRFNCHICHRESVRMGFATRKRLYRHMAFAHSVNPAEEDNDQNRELILNPPPLDPVVVEDAKKSKRGRRKGAKNLLKLDPDTGNLVRTLVKRTRKIHNGSVSKKTSKNRSLGAKQLAGNSSAPTMQVMHDHTPASLWTVATWPPHHNFSNI